MVITGVSGSGKSSLAFDTLYAEGQRRYVESLSAYARQFLEQMEKPDVDSIEGLSPAISIEQKTTSRNPRSTVGTVTEIYDYLRLLFASVGRPHCHRSAAGRSHRRRSSRSWTALCGLPAGTRVQVLAPYVRGQEGRPTGSRCREMVRRASSARASTGRSVDLSTTSTLDKQKKHTIEIVVDRLVVQAATRGVPQAPHRLGRDRARVAGGSRALGRGR